MNRLLICALFLSATACDAEESSDPPSEIAQALEASEAAWRDMRGQAEDSYWYRADRTSVTQWTSSTWVEVVDGEVARVETEIRDEGGGLQAEASDFVGIAPAVTLDELYAECDSTLRDGGILTFESAMMGS